MTEPVVSEWKINKWPFLAAFAVLSAAAEFIVLRSIHPLSTQAVWAVVICVALGAQLGCLPFILEYRAVKKLIEVNAVSTVANQLHDLQTYSAQIAAATSQWALVQDATKDSAEKTAAAAKEIADRMTAEIRDFTEFQQKMNDSERAARRLEVEKLRRSEGEWLQILVRVMDHIHALHTAAARSGQPEVAAQIGNFQNACRGVVRRVGLIFFGVEPGEKFDAQKHRAHGVENPPAEAAIAELLAPGVSFQSQLVRPALVRLQEKGQAPAAPAPKSTGGETGSPAGGELSLEAD
jgi:molecular chaperone GrpE (heat shock protein)